MTSIPPESLSALFVELDFLAASMPNQKPCFKKKYYVAADSWMGYMWRRLDGEEQPISGNNKISSICRNASELFPSYGTNKFFGDIFLTKIVEARKGLVRIRDTYKALRDISTESSVNTSILILDGLIPIERKIIEGFLFTTQKQKIDEYQIQSELEEVYIVEN